MIEILPQIIWFSLLASAIYALMAIGLSLIFGILGFINFAHGDFAMVGAYIFFALIVMFGLPWWIGLILVIAAAVVLGIIIEKLTFKPVRKSPTFTPLIISIGVGALLQAIVILIFGTGVKSYRVEGHESLTYNMFDGALIVTQSQIVLILATIGLLIALYMFLKYSKTGKAIRAVADNKEIAAILGINIDRTISIIFAISTALAAIGGLLIASEQNLSVTMGISLGVKAFAAVILGGVGSLLGAVIGALIIGFSENFLIGFTPIPANFKDAIVFIILIVMLFIRPNGIMGEKADEDIRK